jgi:hypothetical protein
MCRYRTLFAMDVLDRDLVIQDGMGRAEVLRLSGCDQGWLRA